MTLDELNWHIHKCALLEQRALNNKDEKKSSFWRRRYWNLVIRRYRLECKRGVKL